MKFGYYLRMIFGSSCAYMLGWSLLGVFTLPEDMRSSHSPFVQAAPFFYMGFIFMVAWLCYACFAAAANDTRRVAERPLVRWGLPAFLFALGISVVATLCFMWVFNATPVHVNVG